MPGSVWCCTVTPLSLSLQTRIYCFKHSAIKFTPAGGSVNINLSAENTKSRINIIGTGCGILPVERTALLLRFHRTNTNLNQGGFGLGLPIVAAFQESVAGTHVTVLCAQ